MSTFDIAVPVVAPAELWRSDVGLPLDGTSADAADSFDIHMGAICDRIVEDWASGHGSCTARVPDAVQGPAVPAILKELSDAGLSWAAIARLVGVSRRSIHYWRSGSQVSDAHAERLTAILSECRELTSSSAQQGSASLRPSVAVASPNLADYVWGSDDEHTG